MERESRCTLDIWTSISSNITNNSLCASKSGLNSIWEALVDQKPFVKTIPECWDAYKQLQLTIEWLSPSIKKCWLYSTISLEEIKKMNLSQAIRVPLIKTQTVPTNSPSTTLETTSSPIVPDITTNLSSRNEDESISILWIVSLVIGIVCIIIGIFISQCYKKKKKKNEFSIYHPIDDEIFDRKPIKKKNNSILLIEESILKLNTKNINYKDIIQKDLIGSGTFGQVWLGIYKGEKIAIKKSLFRQGKINEIQPLIDEIYLMSIFNSPYIVKLIGISWTNIKNLKSIMEYMDQGDLRDKLSKTNKTNFLLYEKLYCMLSIAEGLIYVHSYDIIHRDLKSRNILIDSRKGTKLTDFGIARQDTQDTMTMGVGTYRWMAPELLKDSHYTVAADIYSFGILLSEFDTHLIPYSDHINHKGIPLVDTNIMAQVVLGTLQPTFTDTCPVWLKDLGLKCISHDPTMRPTAMHVSMILRQHIKAMEMTLNSSSSC